MKRETPNAKRRAVSISPSSKNHMTATIRRGFALLIENGLTQGVIGRISYKIDVEGGTYKGVTARRESNDYGVMETKIDKYEFTASFVGEGAKDVEVAVAEDAAVVTDEQVAEADTLTIENAHTAYTVEDKAHPEYGFRLFSYQDQPMNDGKKPLSSIGTGSNSKVIFESEYHLYRIVHTRAEVGLKGNQASETEAAEVNFSTGKVAEESAPDYRDKEILITMHCPVKGHKVARIVSMDMFSIPDYNAYEGWECNIITDDEGKRVELIKQWIDERANEQHESNLEFVKYEIVKEGVFAERDLNCLFKLEAEKQGCESAAEVATEAMLDIQETEKVEANPVDSNEADANEIDYIGSSQVKVGDTIVSYSKINEKGMRVKTTSVIKHVFDNALQLKEYFEQDCITERSMNDAFKPFYNCELNFHCPLWHYVEGEKLWLEYNDESKVYCISYVESSEVNEILNSECRILVTVWNEEKKTDKAFAVEMPVDVFLLKDHTCPDGCDYTDDHAARIQAIQRWINKKYNIEGCVGHRVIDYKVIRPKASEGGWNESREDVFNDTHKKKDEPEESKVKLTLDQEMTVDNLDESLLEANGVWGGEFRGQWKYKILHKNEKFFRSSDRRLALGHAISAYNSIPVADRVGTKEEAYDKINKARYGRLNRAWGSLSMEELSGMMQDCKKLSSSLFNSALNGMDARPFSVAMNRSVRNRLSVGYVGETIADLAFYIEERAKIEAIVE